MRRKTKTIKRLFSLTVVAVVALLALTSAQVPLSSIGGLLSKAGGNIFLAHAGGELFNDAQVVCEINSGADAKSVAQRYGMTVKRDLKNNQYVFSLPKSLTVLQAASLLNADPDVSSAEPNYLAGLPEVTQRSVAFVHGQSGSLGYYFQDALGQIHAREALAIANGTGVTVAVIDTGIDASHPIFTHVTQGYDFVADDTNPSEERGGKAYGHGTMMAGIIVAVAPGATIMPLRAFGPDGYGSSSDVADAIGYAASHGANVINMSYGLDRSVGVIKKAIQFAWKSGVVMIAAAGNEDSGSCDYPASDNSHVISVAAVDNKDAKADFSNYGGQVNVSAPGVKIHSAFPGGQFAESSGTSQAAAFVSAEAALVISAGGSDARWSIEHSAVNIDGFNPNYRKDLGKGRIDVLAAILGRR